jgi:hypothetical protein
MATTNQQNELSREQRVALATRVYGAHYLTLWLTEAKNQADLDRIDSKLDCAGVPHHHTLLSEREKEVLQQDAVKILQVATEGKPQMVLVHQNYNTKMHLPDGRIALVHVFAERNDTLWAAGLDADGEEVLVKAHHNDNDKFGFVAVEAVRKDPGFSMKPRIDSFLGASWMFSDELADMVWKYLQARKKAFSPTPLMIYPLKGE